MRNNLYSLIFQSPLVHDGFTSDAWILSVCTGIHCLLCKSIKLCRLWTLGIRKSVYIKMHVCMKVICQQLCWLFACEWLFVFMNLMFLLLLTSSFCWCSNMHVSLTNSLYLSTIFSWNRNLQDGGKMNFVLVNMLNKFTWYVLAVPVYWCIYENVIYTHHC